MFFFLKMPYKKCSEIKPLQVHAHVGIYQHRHEKRTSHSAPLDGSMTVEAAVVLPLLLCAFVGFLMWGKIFVLQQEVESALVETGRQIARKEYLYSSEKKEGSSIHLAKTLFMKQKKQGDFTKELEASFFNMSRSRYKKETGEIYLCVTYQVKLPLLLLGTWRLPLTCEVSQKAWNGYCPTAGESMEEAGYVYIAEDGEVYHKDSQCYHLHVTVKEVTNVDRYYKGDTSMDACSFCVKSGKKKKLCVTPEGECYHEDISCSGLIRRVHAVSKKEYSGRRPCKECGY